MYSEKKKANWFGHILRRKCILKRTVEGKLGGTEEKKYKEEDVSSCWMTVRKREDTGN